jgi:acetate CoA/acetoacetate CoA-transferase alpha subunit
MTTNKETTLSEAVGRIESGSTVMVGGFMTVGTPEELVDELVRGGQTGLRVVCNDAGTPGAESASWSVAARSRRS